MPDLVEQPGGDRVAVHPGVGHRGVGVERPGRHEAPEPGHGLQPRHEAVAPRAQLLAHPERRRLVAEQRLDEGVLDERRGTRHGVDDEPLDRGLDRRRHDPPARAPTGHRVRLGQAVEHDRPLHHPVDLGDRRRRLVEERQPAIDLVGEHRAAGVAHDHLGDALEVRARERAARRIARAVDDHELRPRGDELLEVRRVEAVVVVDGQHVRHGRAAGELHHRAVDGEARIRQDHLVALADEREDREEHDRLRAGRDDDLVGVRRHAARRGEDVGDRRARLRDAGRLHVVRVALAERLDRGVHDVGRGVEAGLADLEVHDAAPGRLQRACAGEDLEGGLRPEARHPVGEIDGLHGAHATDGSRGEPVVVALL